ncbi:hypothetical protein [Pseudoruegeria sp. SK021]|uniref:hypothetical protein n=1 Tax=Pseudoruegeria sp. SK021 TaxID=1933035 RepID=UPI000A2151F2|nr:hypothetical protein [Pseudoruegeria sp. SK021]OSP56829.1 hypothetical protein BV911_02510 [Pseudoruegeria sp. SK021]
MPNFDTGHLFLTFLTPIKGGSEALAMGGMASHEQIVKTVLGLLPTALQSPATRDIGENSPFCRNRQTHLCRYMVLDDVTYNGRTAKNALVASIQGQDPIHPQPVDRLNAAYLMFAADIDAVMDEGDPLPAHLDPDQQAWVRDAYLRRLWTTMQPELRSIYRHCYGFEAVTSAEDFAAYMARCQIETTLPFNDYWIAPPTLSNLPIKALGIVAATPVVAALLGLIGVVLGLSTAPVLGWITGWGSGATALIGTLVSVAVLYGVYRYVMANGQNPMPPAKYGDLPSVLKSLYLQQTFADFTVESQGQSPEALHAAFGHYIDNHKPADKMAPSQAPGVISIAAEGGVI